MWAGLQRHSPGSPAAGRRWREGASPAAHCAKMLVPVAGKRRKGVAWLASSSILQATSVPPEFAADAIRFWASPQKARHVYLPVSLPSA